MWAHIDLTTQLSPAECRLWRSDTDKLNHDPFVCPSARPDSLL